jgi:hypothetical protein
MTNYDLQETEELFNAAKERFGTFEKRKTKSM